MLAIGYHTDKGDHRSITDAWIEDLYILPEDKHIVPASQIVVAVTRTGIAMKLDKETMNDYIKKKKLRAFVHAPYTTNSLDFWNGAEPSRVRDQLKLCDNLNVEGLVVHIPRLPAARIAATLSVIEEKTTLLLENHCYKPKKNYVSYNLPEGLNILTESLTEAKVKNWGYCIDTAHMWSGLPQGTYDISTKEGMDKWLSKLSEDTKKRIKLIHLNGSEYEQGRGADLHAIAVVQEKDLIWHKYYNIAKGDDAYPHIDNLVKTLMESSLASIVEFAIKYNIAVVMEPKRGSKQEIYAVLNLLTRIANKISSR